MPLVVVIGYEAMASPNDFLNSSLTSGAFSHSNGSSMPFLVPQLGLGTMSPPPGMQSFVATQATRPLTNRAETMPPTSFELEKYLEHVDKLSPSEQCSLGAMLVLQRRTDDALRLLVQLQDQLAQGHVHNTEGCLGDTLLNLGIAYHFQNKHAESVAYFQKAMAEYDRIGDLNSHVLATAHCINRFCLAEDYAPGLALALALEPLLADDAVAVIEAAELLRFLCLAAECACECKNVDAGIRFLNRAELLANDAATAGAVAMGLGACFNSIDKFDTACTHHHRAVTLLEPLGDRSCLAQLCENYGYAEACRANYDRAGSLYELAIENWQALNDGEGECRARARLAAVQLWRGEAPLAVFQIQQAITTAARINSTMKSELEEKQRELWAEMYRPTSPLPAAPAERPPSPPVAAQQRLDGAGEPATPERLPHPPATSTPRRDSALAPPPPTTAASAPATATVPAASSAPALVPVPPTAPRRPTLEAPRASTAAVRAPAPGAAPTTQLQSPASDMMVEGVMVVETVRTTRTSTVPDVSLEIGQPHVTSRLCTIM